ncbi:MAG: TVP38/TMEM64 family protein [Bacilli bacterium]|nr:TVP38/TMEM64 family protein [Bacilli bacterium]
MEDILSNIDTFITNILESLGLYGPLLGCFLILVESILPILPLSVFITLNFYTFGHLVGFLISYILTLCGCNLAFFLSRKVLRERFEYLLKRFDKARVFKLVLKFSDIKLQNLVVLLAFPFTPAFLVNIFGGVSEMKYRKFLTATIIAKPFMVYFWGYLGVTLLDSLTHPIYFIKVVVMLAIAYVLSLIVTKKLDLN